MPNSLLGRILGLQVDSENSPQPQLMEKPREQNM